MFAIEQVGTLPIYHASTKDRELLALAFLRMQEHYESPWFRGKVFTHEEYRRWYTEARGAFSYASDWSGFNVPSTAVRAVIYRFPNHSREEKLLFSLLVRADIFTHSRFYLIGTTGKHQETLFHERCHALYFTIPEYRRIARTITHRYQLREFKEFLLAEGYHRSVVVDECHAYGMSAWPSDSPRTGEMRQYRKELKKALSPFLKS